jgi:hypothetical protein
MHLQAGTMNAFLRTFALATIAASAPTALAQQSTTAPAKQPAPQQPPQQPPVQVQSLPEIPATPRAAQEIVYSAAFELEVPYEHNMRKDRASVARGHILVLRAPKEFLIPRQLAEPVLLVGGQTAERIAADLDSGLLVVLVPEWTERAKDGAERAGDPLSSRIVFATPELPERVDAAWIEAEQRKAADAGIAPRARAAGEPDPLRVEARDRDALGRFLADILERYAPGESDRIRDLRATS